MNLRPITRGPGSHYTLPVRPGFGGVDLDTCFDALIARDIVRLRTLVGELGARGD